jgi:cyclic beta-1,2-glucan synthetase
MYQAAIEALLGLRRRGSTISVRPCIPAVWPHFSLEWTIGGTRYRFTVSNPQHRCSGVASATLDGSPVDSRAIPLATDGGVHDVTVILGENSGRELPAAAAVRATLQE